MTKKQIAQQKKDLAQIELDEQYNRDMELLNHIKHEIMIKFDDLDFEITQKYEIEYRKI